MLLQAHLPETELDSPPTKYPFLFCILENATCFHQWKSGPFLMSSSIPRMLSTTHPDYSLSPRRHFVSP